MDAGGTQFGLSGSTRSWAAATSTPRGSSRAVIAAVDEFTGGHPPADDRTLLVAVVG